MTDRNAETMTPADANRVCTHERNRQRIVDEVERRFGESRSPFAPSGSVVPASFRANVSIPDVVDFVLSAAEADRDSLLRRIEKLQKNRRVDREVVENAEMTLVKLAEMERERDEALAREAGLRIQLQDRIEAVEHLSGDRNRWKSIAEALRTDLRSERKRADEAIRSKRTTRERLTSLHAAAKQDNARLREDLELFEEFKRRARECVHSDTACGIVYWINNTLNADAYWRTWSCEKHHYGGSGPVPKCPRCAALAATKEKP